MTTAAHAALLDLLRARRSVRRYAEGPVTAAEVRALIDAARHAPSPHNAQPWRFAVLRRAATKERLAEAMADAWRRDLAADGLPAAEIDAQLGRARARLAGAPVGILVLRDTAAGDHYPDARRQAGEEAMAMHAIGAAVQSLMLAATSLGLGSCWMCAPLFCPDAATAALALPSRLRAQALVTVGRPLGDPPSPRGRRSLPEVLLIDED